MLACFVMLHGQQFKNMCLVVLACLRKHYLAFTLALSSLVGNREGDILSYLIGTPFGDMLVWVSCSERVLRFLCSSRIHMSVFALLGET